MNNIKVQVGNETQVMQQLAQPEVVLASEQGQQKVPLQCVYLGDKMYKFDGQGQGYKGCFRIMPYINSAGQMEDPIGAGLMLSERGVNAIWTQLYLFEQNNPDYDTSAYKLAYSDQNQMPLASFRGEVIGPLKIWEIEYPDDIKIKPEYQLRSYTEAGLEDVTEI
jgi:hypothetical protein